MVDLEFRVLFSGRKTVSFPPMPLSIHQAKRHREASCGLPVTTGDKREEDPNQQSVTTILIVNINSFLIHFLILPIEIRFQLNLQTIQNQLLCYIFKLSQWALTLFYY